MARLVLPLGWLKTDLYLFIYFVKPNHVSFWMKNLTEIPIRSFPKIEVPSIIQIET
jgi:hypothetical protein